MLLRKANLAGITVVEVNALTPTESAAPHPVNRESKAMGNIAMREISPN